MKKILKYTKLREKPIIYNLMMCNLENNIILRKWEVVAID